MRGAMRGAVCRGVMLASLSAGLLAVQPDAAFAQSRSGGKSSGQEERVFAGREEAALKFARKHHPELSRLLAQLKQMDDGKYASAVNELFRVSERLGRLQERDKEKYRIELALWKVGSRIRLRVAQSSMGNADAQREEILKLLQQRNALRVEQCELEKARLSARLERLEKQLTDLRTGGDASAERELNRLLKSVRDPAAEKAAAKSSRPRESRKKSSKTSK